MNENIKELMKTKEEILKQLEEINKNITQEEIIYRCNLTHNGFYKYDNFVYKNYITIRYLLLPWLIFYFSQ